MIGAGQVLSDTLEKVAELIVNKEWKIKENEEEILGIEHAGLHMTLKKLIQNDKDATKNDKATFSRALVNYLDSNVVC